MGADASFWAYLYRELTRGYLDKEEIRVNAVKPVTIRNFLKVPWELEKVRKKKKGKGARSMWCLR